MGLFLQGSQGVGCCLDLLCDNRYLMGAGYHLSLRFNVRF